MIVRLTVQSPLVALLVLGLTVAGCDVRASVDLVAPDDVRRTGVPHGAETARVVRHVDGDTLRVTPSGRSEILPDGETSVRLLEIDTPEVDGYGGAGECYGDEASEALATLLPVGDPVHVLPDRELLDRYDRTLLYLWTDDGVFVNEELVRLGYARAVLYEPNDRYIDRMRAAEEEARGADRGLWGAC